MEMETDGTVWFSCTSSGEYHVDPDVTAAFTNGRLAGVLIPSAHTGADNVTEQSHWLVEASLGL